MAVVGVPYSCKELTTISEITGGTPYGASTAAGSDGAKFPTDNELAIARFQGRHVTEIAAKLAGGHATFIPIFDGRLNNSVNSSNSDHRNLGQSYCSLHRGAVAKLTSPPLGNGSAEPRPAQNDIMTGAAPVAADGAAMFAKSSPVANETRD